MQYRTNRMNLSSLLFAFSVVVLSINSTVFVQSAEGQDPQASSRIDQLFNPSHLLKVDIQIDRDDWDKMRKQSRDLLGSLKADEPAESPFEYVRADVTIDGFKIEKVGIRKKGFLGSLDEDRPSLKIRFDKYKDQTPFGEVDRLTLNNNKQDDSNLSQYLSYKLFAEVGVAAPRCSFALVTVNGESLGVYSNVDSLKPPMLKRVFGDGSGLLAEGTLADVLPSAKMRFEYKSEPKNKTRIDELTELLAESETDDARLNSLLNVEQFIKFWAMESLIGFWDGYTHNQNNYFVYENPMDSRLYFIPWGTDSCFTTDVPGIIDPIQNIAVHTNSALANYLYRKPETRQRYLETLEVFLKHWDESDLLDEVDKVEKLLSEAVLSKPRFQNGLDRVRDFIESRRGAIEKQLAKWPVALEVGPRTPGLVTEFGSIGGRFRTTWTKEAPKEPESLGATSANFQLYSEELDFKLLGVTTNLSEHYDDRARDGIKTPTIVFTGVRKSDGRKLIYIAKVKPDDFHPSKKKVPVNGVLIEGGWIAFFTMLSVNPGAIKLINGSVQLEQASMEDGAAVIGKADLKVVGFAEKRREKVRWKAN